MLEVRNISVSYGAKNVLADVSFSLERGTIAALLGANGAGKTTLLRALNGSVALSQGRILLDSVDITRLGRRSIAKKIAVVAQENETKFPMTVMEFVLAGRFAHGGAFGWESEGDFAAAERAIGECDLESFQRRLMNELSGGERQRVVLARALATEAELFLLDEPSANLDLAHQALMFRAVLRRCRELGNSAVVITHDLNAAAAFADVVVLLKAGRILSIGEPDTVLNAADLLDTFDVDVVLDRNPSSGKVRVTTVY